MIRHISSSTNFFCKIFLFSALAPTIPNSKLPLKIPSTTFLLSPIVKETITSGYFFLKSLISCGIRYVPGMVLPPITRRPLMLPLNSARAVSVSARRANKRLAYPYSNSPAFVGTAFLDNLSIKRQSKWSSRSLM